MIEENLVKKTCKELGINQKELAEIMGLTDRTLSKYATSNKISKNITSHLNLMLENLDKNRLIESLKHTIRNFS